MTAETIQLLAQLVGNLGFPVFVAIYLLTRVDAALRSLHETMSELAGLIRALHRDLDDADRERRRQRGGLP